MKRNERAQMAKETVAICELGSYSAPSGKQVSIREALKAAQDNTVLYSLEKQPVQRTSGEQNPGTIQVKNETTFQALERLAAAGCESIGCLNFASAKNPGGGFLKGSLAQEEALACASGLYPCLLKVPEYYERNRWNRSSLYLDMAIFAPLVPFFRTDAGQLIEKPILASVITAPAPNAGAIAANEPRNRPQIEPTLKRRAELVLAIASAHKIEHLVLGAWGCGVFRNDPKMVARAFAELVGPGAKFGNVFRAVVFAVFDRSEQQHTYEAFAEQFGGGD